MVQAWYMDDEDYDQRERHYKNPPEDVSLEDLQKLTGVEYLKLNIETLDSDGILDELKKERGYTYEDEVQMALPKDHTSEDYKKMMDKFFTEHLHTDEEIRLCIKGSGYFDVRDKNDKWIRVLVIKGDLLIVPAGIYHRFTLDTDTIIFINKIVNAKITKEHARKEHTCSKLVRQPIYLHDIYRTFSAVKSNSRIETLSKNDLAHLLTHSLLDSTTQREIVRRYQLPVRAQDDDSDETVTNN